jgi:hypothetical protein
MIVRNKDRLFAKLRKLAPAAAKELEKAGGQSADEMVRLARQFAPKRSGDLIESIVATPPGGTTPDHSQGSKSVPPGAFMVTAGNSKVRYPHFAEYGVKGGYTVGGQFEGATHPGSPAQPFFWPAFRLTRRKHKSRARKALKTSIEGVARK